MSTHTHGVPNGYKRTEVGVIPNDWLVRQVTDVCDFIVPGRNKPKHFDGQIPWVTTPDLTDGGSVSESRSGLCITKEEAKSVGSKIVPRGSVLMSCAGDLGIVAFVERDMVINQQLHAFLPTKAINGHFLKFALKTRMDYIDSIATKTAVPYLNKDNCNSIQIAFPPLNEQNTIAAALSDADGLIESLEKLIFKKRQIKHGTMQELLTGHRRLPGFSGNWNSMSMRQVLTQNATYGIVTAGKFVQTGVKMLRGGDISDGRVNTELPMVTHEKAAEYARTTLVKDDVVIALVGYPGASAKIPEQLIGANISRAVGLLRLNGNVSADYLVCFLNSPEGRRMVLAPSAGSAQQVVNLAALNKLLFTVPSLPEQTAIAAILSDMDAEIAALETKLAKARHMKQGMMQELLTGRTRLI